MGPKLSNKDIATKVTKYAQEKGIRIMSCWVIRNRFVRDQVGCKVSVPKEQSQKCRTDIWPQYITCREWEDRKRKGRRNFDDQDTYYYPDNNYQKQSGNKSNDQYYEGNNYGNWKDKRGCIGYENEW